MAVKQIEQFWFYVVVNRPNPDLHAIFGNMYQAPDAYTAEERALARHGAQRIVSSCIARAELVERFHAWLSPDAPVFVNGREIGIKAGGFIA